MNILLAQLIQARRNEDLDGWMNILFVVVLAVFWALGGILKARKSAQGQQKTPSARPRQHLLKRSERYAAPAARRPVRPGAGQARDVLAEWRAAARKFAAEAEQAFRVQTAEPPPVPQHVLREPETRPVTPESPVFAARLPVTAEEPVAPGPLKTPPEEYLDEILSDYADSNQLRRAILHYEILGRPLALRDPQEPGVGGA